MRRAGDLFGKIVELDNLQTAFLKARRGKTCKDEVILYSKGIGENLRSLQKELLSGNIEIGNYHTFTVYDPKERQIYAAPFLQRVMHHAMLNVCHDRFEKAQIFDSYASRIEKGTYAALNRAYANCCRYGWYLKLDIRKYFDNIDHEILASSGFLMGTPKI